MEPLDDAPAEPPGHPPEVGSAQDAGGREQEVGVPGEAPAQAQVVHVGRFQGPRGRSQGVVEPGFVAAEFPDAREVGPSSRIARGAGELRGGLDQADPSLHQYLIFQQAPDGRQGMSDPKPTVGES